MRLLERGAVIILSLCVFLPAFEARAVEPDAPQELLSKDTLIALKVREKLDESRQIGSANLRESYEDFYTERKFSPIWIGRDGLTRHAKQIMKEIRQADDYGLRASDYRLPNVSALEPIQSASFDTLADTEVALSIAAVHYARDAKGARINPKSLSGYLDMTPKLPSPKKVLAGIAAADDAANYLRKQHPQRKEFEALRRNYVALTRGSRKKVQGPLMPAGPTLRLGDSHDQVITLRKRLKLSANGTDADKFDDDVLDAVKAFQAENGLMQDGIVGSGTRAALNGRKAGGVSAEATRLLVNMERWRWYPDSFGDYYISMNIPEQLVRIVKNGKVIYEARTIIGKVTNQTAVFSDEMEHMVFHPTWSVPNSIKVDEILPYLKNNTGWFFSSDPEILKTHNLYVAKNGQQIDPSKVNWSQTDIRQYHIYQPPGPKNVLGIVKFMFPNRHAIYMHDTLEKQFFSNAVRMHSHGCVRIQDPKKFASVLLKEDKGWPSSRVDGFVASSGTNTVQLQRHVPVHLTYFTAWVSDDGKLHTRPDIYGHDRRMASALRMGPTPVAAPQAVASFPKPVKKRKKQSDDYDEPISLMSILQAF